MKTQNFAPMKNPVI